MNDIQQKDQLKKEEVKKSKRKVFHYTFLNVKNIVDSLIEILNCFNNSMKIKIHYIKISVDKIESKSFDEFSKSFIVTVVCNNKNLYPNTKFEFISEKYKSKRLFILSNNNSEIINSINNINFQNTLKIPGERLLQLMSILNQIKVEGFSKSQYKD